MRISDWSSDVCSSDLPDPCPVVKFFNPLGAATWLATELGRDGDTLFGLADLGFGCTELGYFSLSEIRAVRLPYGLWLERDLSFDSSFHMPLWPESAPRAGSTLWAEHLLRRAAHGGPNTENRRSGSEVCGAGVMRGA